MKMNKKLEKLERINRTLMLTLKMAHDHLYNSFEPNSQSEIYKQIGLVLYTCGDIEFEEEKKENKEE